MMGGLRASLRTDVLQMSVFAVVLALIIVMLMRAQGWLATAAITSGASSFDAGCNLLVVALLQVWSYPMHDPVMMDRGFIGVLGIGLTSFAVGCASRSEKTDTQDCYTFKFNNF